MSMFGPRGGFMFRGDKVTKINVADQLVDLAANSNFARFETCPVCLLYRGRVFTFSWDGSVSSTGTQVIIITTGTIPARLILQDYGIIAQPGRYSLTECSSATPSVTPVAVFNTNRTSDVTSGATVTQGGTFTGTVIGSGIIGAGKGAGGSDELSNLLYLKPETSYAITLTNSGNQSALMSARWVWVEQNAAG